MVGSRSTSGARTAAGTRLSRWLCRAEVLGEPPGRGARRDRCLLQQPAPGIVTDSVQPGQTVLAEQLRAGHPDQQLPTTETSIALLDRTDPGIESTHQPEAQHELVDRRHPGQPGQGRVRRADLHPPPSVLGPLRLPPYSTHPAGALP